MVIAMTVRTLSAARDSRQQGLPEGGAEICRDRAEGGMIAAKDAIVTPHSAS